ncbi:MAG: polysaccharide biosynthesis C-terminal domain-containing protein [Planctomycetes bacterium]|nr:polysaccharide biosynthesis C-terminal domain-containing protein [Planctomycetota bacterium]
MQFNRVAIANDWRKTWRLSRWALLSMLLGRATSYLMPWIILWAYDARRTALLGMCMTLIGVPNMVIVAMCNCMRPRLFREYAEGGLPALKRMLLRSSVVFAIAPSLFLIALLVLGDYVGTFFYGPACVGSGIILAVMTLGRLAGGIGMAIAAGLWAIDRPQDNVMPNVWDLVLTLGGAALLVPSYGVIGAATATALGNIACALSRWQKLRRSLHNLTTNADLEVAV